MKTDTVAKICLSTPNDTNGHRTQNFNRGVTRRTLDKVKGEKTKPAQDKELGPTAITIQKFAVIATEQETT